MSPRRRTGNIFRSNRFGSKGGSRGRGVNAPPPSLACAIFLRVVVGVQTYHAAYSHTATASVTSH